MDVCLYDQIIGFYGAGKAAIGREGDFYTSVSVGSLFGELLALQAEEVWEKLGRPGEFHIIEQGGHDARLGCDMLSAIDQWAPKFGQAVRYTVCDRLPDRGQQRDPRILICDRIESIQGGGAAFFFCNELLDAFPVHRIRFREGGWKELWVRFADDHLGWEERPLSPDLEMAIASRVPSDFCYPNGYTTEICLEIDSWMQSVAAAMGRGMALVIDYGFFAPDYYVPERTDGTLRCYSGHRADDDPLIDPGERDITAHVDWSAVEQAGGNAGLARIGFADQGAYLTRLVAPLMKRSEKGGDCTRIDRKWIRQFQTLTHPGMMGRSFGAMAFEKAMDPVGWKGFSPTN